MRSFRFKPSERGLETILGKLERPVMEVVWRKGQATVQDVSDALASDHAYTTLKTIMDRLEKKGFLRRVKEGRPVIYEATISEAELEEQASRSVIEGLVSQLGSAAMVQFVEVVQQNPQQLKELRKLLEQLPDKPVKTKK